MKKLTISVESGHGEEVCATLEVSSDPALNSEKVKLTVRRDRGNCLDMPGNTVAKTNGSTSVPSPKTAENIASDALNIYLRPEKSKGRLRKRG